MHSCFMLHSTYPNICFENTYFTLKLLDYEYVFKIIKVNTTSIQTTLNIFSLNIFNIRNNSFSTAFSFLFYPVQLISVLLIAL